MTGSEPSRQWYLDFADRLGGAKAVDVVSLSGGGNSRSFRVVREDGGSSFLKFYPRTELDPNPVKRDRMRTEVAALSFLADNDVTNVPKVLAWDEAENALMTEWIDGAAVEDIGSNEISLAARFVHGLRNLGSAPGAEGLASASEACFSGQSILSQIEDRFERFVRLSKEEKALHELLKVEFRPVLERVVEWAGDGLAGINSSLSTLVPEQHRILSPSDFGFHNAIRRSDGEIIFVDFEYFGWDDPVKLVADFLLHPGMKIGEPLKQEFVGEMRRVFRGYELFDSRLKYLLPLHDLRWCMILLNPFDPQYWRSRMAENIQIKSTRLEKMRHRLSQLRNGNQYMDYED